MYIQVYIQKMKMQRRPETRKKYDPCKVQFSSSTLNIVFNDFFKERNNFTVAGNHEYMQANSLQSSLISHSLRVTLNQMKLFIKIYEN